MEIFHFNPTSLGLNAEDMAMLQALYSRSADSVMVHLEKLQKSGSSNFMSKFYIGYGHGSIGDCGDVYLFIEGVSILAAKSIQDTPLYNGQESSTRYINWLAQPFYNPRPDDMASVEIFNYMREFYATGLDELPKALRDEYPIQEGQKPADYDRAINARAFDILRGFLPAGATTNLSWKGSLRTIHERLLLLFNHPLSEVQKIAADIHDVLLRNYPSSYKEADWYTQADKIENVSNNTFYSIGHDTDTVVTFAYSGDPSKFLKRYNSRNGLNPELDFELGLVRLTGVIDYGSHRDLQRHRRGVNVMPLLDTHIGFNEWYLEEIDRCESLSGMAQHLMTAVESYVENLDDEVLAQYFIPMGYNVQYKLLWSWSQLLYVLRLRSTNVIHPTLRKQVHAWVESLTEDDVTLPEGLVDTTPTRWDIKRGSQTILAR